MSAEMERRVVHVVWSDNVTNGEKRQRTNTKDIVVVAHSLKWKWGSNGSEKTGTRCINSGCKVRQRENWETENPMADTFQRETGGHWSGTAKTRSELSRYA